MKNLIKEAKQAEQNGGPIHVTEISPTRKDDPLLIRELFQWNQKKRSKKIVGGTSVTTKKHDVVNMNDPPKDMPIEEIERFWGKILPEEGRKFAEELRKIKPKKGIRKPKPRVL